VPTLEKEKRGSRVLQRRHLYLKERERRTIGRTTTTKRWPPEGYLQQGVAASRSPLRVRRRPPPSAPSPRSFLPAHGAPFPPPPLNAIREVTSGFSVIREGDVTAVAAGVEAFCKLYPGEIDGEAVEEELKRLRRHLAVVEKEKKQIMEARLLARPQPEVGVSHAGLRNNSNFYKQRFSDTASNVPHGLESLTTLDQLFLEYCEFAVPVRSKILKKYFIKNTKGQIVYYGLEESDCYNVNNPDRQFTMRILDDKNQQVMILDRDRASSSCCCCCCSHQ
ncbi:unnamed protein product, partial [Cyprideis torosa]